MRHQLSQCFKPRQLVVLLQLLQQLRGIGRQQALAPGGLQIGGYRVRRKMDV